MRVLTLILILLALLTVTWASGRFERALDQFTQTAKELTVPEPVNPDDVLTTTWTDWEGLDRKVVSNRKSGETDTAFVARHGGLVDVAKAAWPLTEPQ